MSRSLTTTHSCAASNFLKFLGYAAIGLMVATVVANFKDIAATSESAPCSWAVPTVSTVSGAGRSRVESRKDVGTLRRRRPPRAGFSTTCGWECALSAARTAWMKADHGLCRAIRPQPFHLDAEAARTSLFGGLVASGWHTAALSMRLMVEGGIEIAGGLVGVGGEVSWLKPTRPGDILQVESEIVDLSGPGAARSGRGDAPLPDAESAAGGSASAAGETARAAASLMRREFSCFGLRYNATESSAGSLSLRGNRNHIVQGSRIMALAVRFHQTGGPEVLKIETVEVPPPGPGEVRIAVKALGLNRAESMFRRGEYLENPKFPAAGLRGGRHDRIGWAGCRDLKPGDAVSTIPGFSQNQYGVYGDLVLAPAAWVAKHPAELSPGPKPPRFGCRSHSLRCWSISPSLSAGQTILIPAASSSVGLAAIQIARLVGAVPIALTQVGQASPADRTGAASVDCHPGTISSPKCKS